MNNIKILVLEGGSNEEHDVSLSTGIEVKKSLNRLNIYNESIVVNPKTFKEDISNFDNSFICFNALHGPFGEDGKIQKILGDLNFKFTHSSYKASNNGFDKNLTKRILKNTCINIIDSSVVDCKELNKNLLKNFFYKYDKFIMKPVSSGSSFGIKVIKSIEDIKSFEFNNSIYCNHNRILIEKYIEGRELTVGVIDRGKESLPIGVTEILYKKEFFDYDLKYTNSGAKHILPANIPYEIYKLCKDHAKIAHDKIECKDVSRSDFIYKDNKVYFLEINTQPGLTSLSLVPEQLKYKKISFDYFIKNIIKNTYE